MSQPGFIQVLRICGAEKDFREVLESVSLSVEDVLSLPPSSSENPRSRELGRMFITAVCKHVEGQIIWGYESFYRGPDFLEISWISRTMETSTVPSFLSDRHKSLVFQMVDIPEDVDSGLPVVKEEWRAGNRISQQSEPITLVMDERDKT